MFFKPLPKYTLTHTMKVVVYNGEKKVREGQFFPNASVRDVSTGNSPQNPGDEEQQLLAVEGGSLTTTLSLMFSALLNGWVSSVFHPGYLPENHHARVVNENLEVSKVA